MMNAQGCDQTMTCTVLMLVYDSPYLVVHDYVHDVIEHLSGPLVLRPPGKDDKLNAQKRHQDQGGSHGLHVHVGLCPMGVPQLGHQHTHNVQQEEQVYLR